MASIVGACTIDGSWALRQEAAAPLVSCVPTPKHLVGDGGRAEASA
jgi:hypothetical protein